MPFNNIKTIKLVEENFKIQNNLHALDYGRDIVIDNENKLICLECGFVFLDLVFEKDKEEIKKNGIIINKMHVCIP